MFENQNNNNGIIQTQDLFLMKEGDAAEKIGRHLLIIAHYKNGAVVGNRFDNRQNEERRWIKKINAESLIVGLGQYGVFDSFCRFADSLKLSLTSNILPERYVTLPVYDKFLTPMIASSYEAGRPLALDIIYANLRASKLKMVRFNGDIGTYTGFGILGGYPYQDQPAQALTGEEVKGKTQDQLTEMMRMKFMGGVRHPVKAAVKKMESFFGEKKHLDTMDEAMDAVKATFFECDPPFKKEMFEFTVFEKGDLNSIYVPRPKPVSEKAP